MKEIVMRNIYNDIKEISSRYLQEESWLGNDPNKCSSYTEVMCRLFDDNRVEDFLKSTVLEIGFSQELILVFNKLVIKLNNYSELQPDSEIINDPRWEEIRKIAEKVIVLWDNEKCNI